MIFDLGTVFSCLCSFAALVVALGTIKERYEKRPRELEMRLANFENRLSDVEQTVREDRRSINRLLRLASIQSESLAALMDHNIDGNHTEQLKLAAERLKAEIYNLEN